jgi:CHASE3 domain sensor protein
MKVLRIIAILIALGGIMLGVLGAYTYLNNEDQARANRYAAEQQRLLAEAARAQGTPKERELMKEYEDGKGVTDLARNQARQTTQTAILATGGGLALIVVSLVTLMISRRRTTAPSV